MQGPPTCFTSPDDCLTSSGRLLAMTSRNKSHPTRRISAARKLCVVINGNAMVGDTKGEESVAVCADDCLLNGV